jgi:hypothetical protein
MYVDILSYHDPIIEEKNNPSTREEKKEIQSEIPHNDDLPFKKA